MVSFIRQNRKKMCGIGLFAIIVGSCTVPLLITGVTLPVIITFIAGLFFLNLLPGWGVWGLIGRRVGSGWEIAAVMTLGVALDIICYLVGLIASAFWLYIVLVSLLAAAGMYFAFSHLGDGRNCNFYNKISLVDISLLAILLVVTNIILYYNYYLSTPLPGKVDIEYYLDIPWHLGNIAALSLGWFPQDFRLAGYPFHYHFMAYAWMAALKGTCHFSSAMILLRLYPAFFLNLLVFLVWYTGKVMFSGKAAVWAVILFLMAGNFWPFKPYNLFLNNLMYSPTYLLAMVLTLCLLAEMYWYLTTVSNTRNRIWGLAIVIPVMITLAGAKGPFLPAAVAGIFALLILIKRTRTEAAVLFGAGLLIFILSYLVIYRGGGAADLGITMGQLIYNTAVYKDSYAWFHSKGLAYAGLLAVIIYLLAFLGIKWAAIVFSIVKLRERNRQIQYTLLLGMAAAGMAAGYLLQARDNSQYYFLFVGMIAVNLLTADFLARFYRPGQNQVRGLLISFLILIALAPAFQDTYQMIGKNMHATAQRQMLKTKALTPELYEGLVFLSKNTSPQAVVVGRRFSHTAGRRVWFYYSAFSERRVLLEGWEYMPSNRIAEVEKRRQDIVRLYKTNSVTEARDILSRYRIDYLIADKKYRSTSPHFPGQGIITPVFSNDKVIIYKVYNRKTN